MELVGVTLRKEIDNSYNIVIGKNLFSTISMDLKKNIPATKYCILTDSKVKSLYAMQLESELKQHGLNACIVSFPSGESSKNLETVMELHEKLARIPLDRQSVIIALGGGVVGDIAGFVAATYMRGIKFIQIPTTFLSMVDSSVGGKTGVDLKSGKNLVGVFYQPKKVYIDVSLLKKLPEKEMKNGLAEVIKTAAIGSRRLFNFLEKNVKKLLKKNDEALIYVIKECCEFKAKIVEEDETEKNLRKILNYGHTIGHAIESATGYKKFSHGQAIAIGMAVEGKIAAQFEILNELELKKQNKLLKSAGLGLKLPKISPQKILNAMQNDKKALNGEIRMVLPECIGTMKKQNGEYAIKVERKEILKALK